MNGTATQVLWSQKTWLAGSEGSYPMHGKCMVWGTTARTQLGRLAAFRQVLGTALCDMICGRPAVGASLFWSG